MKKILGFDCHSALWSAYALLGYDIDLMFYNPNFAWSEKEKPIPSNVRILPLGHKINPDDYFVGIANNERIQAPIMRGMGIPFITSLASNGKIVDKWKLSQDRLVFCGHAQRERLGFSSDVGDVIYYPIDTDKFNGWTGCGGYVMSMVRHIRKAQGQGFDRWLRVKDLCHGIEFKNFGRQADGLEHPETGCEENTIYALQCAGAYFDPVDQSPLSFSCLEALACGTPFITTPHDEWPIILGSQSAYICKTDEEIVNAVKDVLANPEKARAIGQRGREVIRYNCNKENWIKQWERIFDEMGVRR